MIENGQKRGDFEAAARPVRHQEDHGGRAGEEGRGAEAEAEAGAGAAQAARAAAEEAAAEVARVRAEKAAVEAVARVLNRESEGAASEAWEAEG